MNKEQKHALYIAVSRFGKERVLEIHREHQHTIDEWRCDLRPLNSLSLKVLENELGNI